MARPKKSFALWVLGHVLYGLFALVIFAFCALIIWRVFIANRVPKELKQLAPNQVLAEAYRANGNNLTLFTQDQATVTRAENNSGFFSMPLFVFVEEAKQVQVIFRYNNGALGYVKDAYKLSEKPAHGERTFALALSLVSDLTPENKEDNKDGSETLATTHITPTTCEVSTTLLYTYYRLTFDNVSCAEDVLTVFLDIYYAQDVNFEKPALGTLRLYHYESARIAEKLSNKEREALENFGD